ncbi:MAG: hypothetical protein H6R10_3184 [Rhodocyclaceae bacterium]|nr:hypothetical protein [Rhodocyclaceae bacterium]
MATVKLEKKEWRPRLDAISKALVGKRAEIEVDALSIGSQVESQWLPLLGIAYDPKNDLVEIVVEGLDHLVHKPQEIYIDQDGTSLSSLELVDADGFRMIVKLRDPLMLTVF